MLVEAVGLAVTHGAAAEAASFTDASLARMDGLWRRLRSILHQLDADLRRRKGRLPNGVPALRAGLDTTRDPHYT